MGPRVGLHVLEKVLTEFLAQLSEVKAVVQRHFTLYTDVLTIEAAGMLTAIPSRSWRVWSNLR